MVIYDHVPQTSVFHIRGPVLNAHASFYEFKGWVFCLANKHVIEVDVGEERIVEVTYKAGRDIITTHFICKPVITHGDCVFFNLASTKTGKIVSPFLKPLKVTFVRRYRGVVCAELVGCDVCGCRGQTDLVDLTTRQYRVNTVDGDCGRPVIFYDRNSGGQTGRFILIGIHFLEYLNGKYNGFHEVVPPKVEGIEYFADLPGGAMNPSSEFIYDNTAEEYYGNLIDISEYEIKEINKNIAVAQVDKYKDSGEWRFDDHECEEIALLFCETEYEESLKGLREPLLDVEEFIQAASRQGDGTLSHTSCGFPWSREFQDKVEAMGFCGYEIHAMILDGTIANYPSIFTLFLKDEVRMKRKDIRAILSAPLHHLASCVFLMYNFHKINQRRAADPRYCSSLGIDPLTDLGVVWKKMFEATGFGGSYDITLMDTTISSYHMKRYFSIWRKYVPEQFHSLFDKLMTEVVFTPMRLADGSLWVKSGGNPTGWYGTADLNTWDSTFKFYYAIACWCKECFPELFKQNPIALMKSLVASKHNGDDSLFAFLTQAFLAKKDFERYWNKKMEVVWDDPEHDFSHMNNTTFLSMAPVPENDQWRTTIDRVQLTHCKLARPFTKMFYRKKRQSYMVLYQKTVSLLGLCWFSKRWSTVLLDIKSKLEKRWAGKIIYFPETNYAGIRGEVHLEAKTESPFEWCMHCLEALPRQQGRRSPLKMSGNAVVTRKVSIPIEEYEALQKKKKNKPVVRTKKVPKGKIAKSKVSKPKPSPKSAPKPAVHERAIAAAHKASIRTLGALDNIQHIQNPSAKFPAPVFCNQIDIAVCPITNSANVLKNCNQGGAASPNFESFLLQTMNPHAPFYVSSGEQFSYDNALLEINNPGAQWGMIVNGTNYPRKGIISEYQTAIGHHTWPFVSSDDNVLITTSLLVDDAYDNFPYNVISYDDNGTVTATDPSSGGDASCNAPPGSSQFAIVFADGTVLPEGARMQVSCQQDTWYTALSVVGLSGGTMNYVNQKSNSSRMIANRVVLTDAIQRLYDGGWIYEAKVSGMQPPLSPWYDPVSGGYMTQAKHRRRAKLCGGETMWLFASARDLAFKNANQYKLNPLTGDPTCNVGYITYSNAAAPDSNITQIQVGPTFDGLVEYSTIDPTIASTEVMADVDSYSKGLTFIGAAYRFSSNDAHDAIMKIIVDAAKKVAGGANPSAALKSSQSMVSKVVSIVPEAIEILDALMTAFL